MLVDSEFPVESSPSARARKPTLIIKIGQYSISKTAFQLGVFLFLCQIADGLLTYAGLTMLGVQMEGNAFLRQMMEFYGMAPLLLGAKIAAIIFVFMITIHADTRKWLRPIIGAVIGLYLVAAIIPWTYIISDVLARSSG